jgi:Tfp pilus assembly protein PilO
MTELYRGATSSKDWVAVGVILGLLAVLVLVFLFFVRSGMQQRINEADTVIAQKTQEIAEAREKQANLKELQREMQMIDELVREFENRLPSQNEISRLITEFEAMADEVGVTVSINSLPQQSDLRKTTIPYQVTALGDFHEIASFINMLERFQRYMKVSNLEIMEQELGISEATFTLSTFYFSPRVEAAGAAA